MPRINQNNNLDNSGMNPTNDTVRKLDQLKESWYRQSPPKLFDLSVGVLVENIDLILIKTKKLNAKYYKKYLEKKADNVNNNKYLNEEKPSETAAAAALDDENSTSNSLTLMETNRHLSPYNKKNHLVKNSFYSSRSSRKQFNPFYGLYVKYQLADHVGPLPTVVCEAIIKKYADYYLKQLGLIERQEYFQINKSSTSSSSGSTNNNGRGVSKDNNVVSTQSEPSRFGVDSNLRKKKLISYYDLVMAFSSRPDKCSLNKFEYRQCIWAHSTLEQRINAKKQSQQSMRDLFGTSSSSFSSSPYSSSSSSSEATDNSDTDNFSDGFIRSDDENDDDNISKYYDCLDANYSNNNNNNNINNTSGSSNNMTIDRHNKKINKKQTSSNNQLVKLSQNSTDDLKKIVDLYKSKRRRHKKPKVWRSTRSKQPEHLVDMDLRVALKNHQIEYLDICPCKLTNESIALLNRYFSKNLKYLRFQNCCNWHLKMSQEQQQQQPNQPQQEQPNPTDRPNRIYHHNHLISDSDDDDESDSNEPENLMMNGENESEEEEDDEEEDEDDEFYSEHRANEENGPRRLELAYSDESQSNNMDLVNLRSQLDKLDSATAAAAAAAAAANTDALDFVQNDETRSELQLKCVAGNKGYNEEEDEDEDNDSYEFDAYLEEYLSRYDPNANLEIENKNELEQNTFLNEQLKKKHSSTKKQQQQHQQQSSHHHHHHHHHHHRHHRHHHRRHRCRKHTNESRADLMLKRLMSLHEDETNRTDQRECMLFKASTSIDLTDKGKCSCKLDKLKSKLISSNNTIVGATSSASNRGDEAKSSGETKRDDENNSILKWFVKYAASAAAVSSKSALGLTQHHQSAPSEKSTAKSLLEQLKQKASILTETKMIDKVSITSSLNDTEGVDSKSNASMMENDATSNEYDAESIDYYNLKKVYSDDEKRFKMDNDDDDDEYRRRRLKHLNENSIDSASLNSSSCNSSLCAAKIDVNGNDNNNNISSSAEFESFSSSCSCCCCSSASSVSYYSSASSSSSTSNKASGSSSDEDEDFKSVNSYLYNMIAAKSRKKSTANTSQESRSLSKYVKSKSSNDATTSKSLKGSNSSRKSSVNSNKLYSTNEPPKWFIKHHNNKSGGTFHDNNNMRNKRMRQQRLLEKVANLGSSPINVLQAIAAKALNFKLKNSVSFAQIAENLAKSEHEAANRAAAAAASASSVLTNIEEASNESKKTVDSCIISEVDEQQQQQQATNLSNQLVVDVDRSTSSSSSSCSIDYKKSNKRLREDTTNDAVTKDIEMEEQATSESKNIKIEELTSASSNDSSSQQQASGIPSNLFSVLRLWMSKRVDSINSIKSTQSQATTSEEIKKLERQEEEEEEETTTKKPSESMHHNPDQDLFDLVQMNKIKRSELRKELRKIKKLASKNLANESEANTNRKLVDSKYFDKRIVRKKNSLMRMRNRGMKDYYHDRVHKFGAPVQIIKLDMLQHLSLRNLGNDVIDRNMLNSLLKNFKCLKYLDISNCCTNFLSAQPAIMFASSSVTGVSENNLDGLENLASTLIYLIMADLTVNDIQGNLKHLLRLKKLKHLDISNCVEKSPLNIYKNASLTLAKLAYHLTSLMSLDISGTNLGGPIIFKEADEIDYIQKRLYEDLIDEENDYQRVRLDRIETIKSSVSGLMFLNNGKKRLDFLGCFCCDNSVSSRAILPAVRIAGEESEKHLYTSLETYMQDRPLFLLDALNHLFELYKDEMITDNLLGGHLIMDTMERHLDNSRIQISGSASLFYVLKYSKEENVQMPHFYLARLIRTVINGMEEHIDESAMRRNCVLIMCRLNLPDDVLFVSDRLIKILLKIFDDYIGERNAMPANDRQENFVLRTAMHLLNILACSVHGNDKFIVGSQAIPVAMNLIKTKTRFNEADDILEVTWSFLWNITDETPENCKIFLDLCDGMKTFMECIKFKKSEIIRNMMGLLGNVAEVKELRNRLCKNEFIKTFRDLLFQNNDGIEIPYNSAGVLVHIMSDGHEAWELSDCNDQSRDSVIEDIETAIDKWNLESERNINYRSFEPIFRLVDQYQNPICQRWACWALANLTTVYPEVYCPLFERENGIDILNKLISFENVNPKIRNFAEIVLKNVFNYTKSNAS